jgi:chemotaxis protein CheD
MTPAAVPLAGPEAPPSWDEARSLYLHPGRLLVSAEPATIVTILGSCVSVVLHDPATAIGGLNHFVLPHWARGGAASPRFGNVAMRMLLDEMVQRGAEPSRLEAKVFGGASVLEAYRASAWQLGQDNVRVALRHLADAGVPVTASDVGGVRARRLVFDTQRGDVWLRRL